MESVRLDPESQHFVDDLVESGRFASADDAVRQGLRLLQAEERRRHVAALVDPAIAQVEAGKALDAGTAFDALARKYRKMADEQGR